MQRTLIKLSSVVTMDRSRRILPGGGVLVGDDQIERVLSADDLLGVGDFDGDVVEAPRLTAIPGFIQTHLHLCQTLFRGLADDLDLLHWLTLKIFPFEHAHDAASMRASALVGLAELIRSGTTTILDMGSIRHEEEIARAVTESGIRAFIGKSLMDINDSYPPLKESLADALSSAESQAGQWHGSAGGRVMYAMAPRFVLSCSDRLLRGAQELVSAHRGMLLHTHASENRSELDAVRKRCGMGNVEFLDSIGLLTPASCLAHCVWLSGREMELLARTKTKVLHCPSSNLKLGSGIANVPAMRSKGITVSLGADGAACSNTLDMFREMRLAAMIQRPMHGAGSMSAATVFEMATTEGAKALGVQKLIGSIEEGKKADLVLLDLHRSWNPSTDQSDTYSSIVFSGSPSIVDSVMVDGKWLYRSGEFTKLDEPRILEQAERELRRLLGRVRV